MNRGVVWLWSIVAATILTLAGVFAVNVISNTDAGATPEPSETAVNPLALDKNADVFVLNATPDQQRGTAMQSQLLQLGWSEDKVHLTVSDQTDFAETSIFYAREQEQSLATELATLLGISVVEQSDAYAQLTETGDARSVVIVLGLDTP